MRPVPNILDSEDFDVLEEAQRQRMERALSSPVERDRLMISTLLALRKEQKAAGEHCRTACLPSIKADLKAHGDRIGKVESFKRWLCGVVAGVSGLAGVAAAVYSVVKWMMG